MNTRSMRCVMLHRATFKVRGARAFVRGSVLALSLGGGTANAAAMYLCTDGQGLELRLREIPSVQLIPVHCERESEPEAGIVGPLAPRVAYVRIEIPPRYVPVDSLSVAFINPRSASTLDVAALTPAAQRGELEALIRSAAREQGHDPRLLRAIVQVESNFNAGAVSPKGALGLMQVIPATGARFGIINAGRELHDPVINLRVGAQYLSELLRRFDGHLDLALAAYNAGEGNVIRYKNQIPPFPETQAYVQKVMHLYRQASGTD